MAQIKILKKGTDGYIIENATTDELTLAGFATDGATIDANGIQIKAGNELILYETDTGNYVGFVAPTLTANTVWTLPTADGSAGQVIQTNGSAILGWGDNATVLINNTVNSGATKNIDSVNKTTKKVVKWIAFFSTSTKKQTMEILGLNKESVISYSISNVLGDNISTLIDIKISGDDIIFEVINNEGEILNVSLLRLSI
jgi:hypothetical protein